MDRRQIITGAAAGALGALVSPIGAATLAPDRDANLLAAWAAWCRAKAAYERLPHGAEGEAEAWERIEEAEGIILASRAQTPAGASIKLRLALDGLLGKARETRALVRGEFTWLAAHAADPTARILASTLADLARLGAGA